jgi:TRAP-type mannitol/chloroaromatic compound transport system permease large subunit
MARLLICMQLGLLTPPFGLLLFTMKGVAPPQSPCTLPYIVMSLLILVLIFLFPMIATWLSAVLSR